MLRVTPPILAAFIVATAMNASAGAGDNIQIVGPERPPYIVDVDGKGIGAGPAVDLVRRLAEAAGISPDMRILPFQRAIQNLENGNTLYPALLRTPQRESRFQWIGEVFGDRAVLFTHGDAPAVAGIPDARRLERISVMRGSELHPLLQSFGLGNIETNISEADNARLLQVGRIDGWFTLYTVGRATWSQMNFNPKDLHAGETFALMSFWVAGSRNLPHDIVRRLQETYRMLRKSGEYDRIVAPLRRPPA